MSLNLYKPLGDNDEATRLSAATQLTAELSLLLSSERTDKSKADIDYALKRLTRGLASGRESARPGFAVVLTEFLSALQAPGNPEKWDVDLEKIIEAVKTNTHPQGHTSGQEIRDYSLGRLFGLQSLLGSKILFQSKDSLEKYADVLDLIFELADKKPWLRESCAWTVASTVKQFDGDIAKDAAKTIYDKITSSGFVKSGEGVGIWLALQAHHPDVGPPKGVWDKECPLATGNLTKLAKVLKESGSKDDAEEKSKGSWNPKLGFVWGFILDAYFPSDKRWQWLHDDGRIAAWDQFWTKIVDESLFSSASSEERKYWGFLFFLKSLDHVTTPHFLTFCFSKNFMRSFINQLSDSERYLHKIAQKTVRTLISKSESKPWMAPVIFHQLVSDHGTPNFDQITKTKTLDKILSSTDESGLPEVFKELKEFIFTPSVEDDSPKAAESRRQWAADHFLNMVRSGKTVKPENWLRQLLELFTTLAYFDMDKPTPALSPASQNMFRTRLMSTLTQLIGLNGGKLVNGESWPFYVVRTIQNQRAEGRWKVAVEFDDAIEAALEEAMRAVGKIRRKRSEAFGSAVDTQLLSFEILYSLIILQVFNGESDALSVLEDLKSIQSKILGAAKKKKKRKHEEEGDHDVDPSEVLVDILLSFLSRQSILLKKVSHTVFTAFAPFITKAGLERCFDVLATKEGLGGQQELFDEDNSDDDDAGIASDDADELPSDVEMVDGSDAEDSELDSDVEILSASSDDDDTAGGDASADAQLDAALQEALAPHAPHSSDSDSDASMSSSAMAALDTHLSTIFAARKKAASQKSSQKSAKELMQMFKTKVLDLLEVYVKTVPTSPLALEILLPCLHLARKTRDPKLADKAATVVRSFSHAYSRAPADAPAPHDHHRPWELLAALHDEAGTGGGRKAACSSAAILVAKVLVRRDPENIRRVAEMYAATIARWALQEGFVAENAFFADFVGWVGSIRAGLRKMQKEEGGEGGKKEGKEEGGKREGRKKKRAVKSELAVGNSKKRKSEDDEEGGEVSAAKSKKRRNRKRGKKGGDDNE